MIKKVKNKILIVLLILLVSCEFNIEPVPIPIFEPSNLNGAKKVTDFIKTNSEGIYQAISKYKPLGDTVVLKWHKDRLSVFTGKNTIYLILQAGYKGEDIFCEGFWRQANSESTGLASLTIYSENGGKDLVNNIVPVEITIDVMFKSVDEATTRNFKLKMLSKLNPKKQNFWIIAHKGGGRNIDKLPHSENTIEMIKYAECLGANSIEVDVKLTRDKIPVLFHDDNLTLRTINNEYFIGKINEYDYKLLENSAPLKYGEKIPSLEDALKTVVEETNLKLVWLDIKDPEAVAFVAPLQKKYLERANNLGKELEILIGVPDNEIFNTIVNLDNYVNIPTLCELDESYLQVLNSMIWAPRWSLGLAQDRIQAIHNLGKRAFVWTLDDSKLINRYLRDTDFDGIVTNYSPVVAYEYYIYK